MRRTPFRCAGLVAGAQTLPDLIEKPRLDRGPGRLSGPRPDKGDDGCAMAGISVTRLHGR